MKYYSLTKLNRITSGCHIIYIFLLFIFFSIRLTGETNNLKKTDSNIKKNYDKKNDIETMQILHLSASSDNHSELARSKKIKIINLNDVHVYNFAMILSKILGIPVAVSPKANKIISVYLENTDCETALKIVCRTNGLWYRYEGNAILIETIGEYRRNAKTYREEFIETVTLLYPSVEDMGETIKDLFGNRIVWTLPNKYIGDYSFKIDRALSRMDKLAKRGQFSLQGENSSNIHGTSSSSSSAESMSYNEHRKQKSSSQYSVTRNSNYSPNAQFLPEEFKVNPIVYIAAMPSSNTLILRSSDKQLLKLIVNTIKKLDIPSPQVLLEVKILELRLRKTNSRGFDILFKSGDFSGGFAGGLMQLDGSQGGNIIAKPSIFLNPRGTGVDQQALIFNYISNKVRARIQALEKSGDLKALSTPCLLVSDNEASRIFIGAESTILTELNVETNTTSGNNPVTTRTYDPVTERRNIGTTLLITPKIHADKTVTIRIMQETSERGDIQRIIYGTDRAGYQLYFDSTDINQRTVATTVIAKDGQIIAIGGLIREREEKRKESPSILKDIPLIGSLFERVVKVKIRTELIILIRPFVLIAPGEGQIISDKLLHRLSKHKTSGKEHPELNLYLPSKQKK